MGGIGAPHVRKRISQFLIYSNPDAGVTLLNKTETIKMLCGKMSEIDDTTSTRSEKIFNDLLDDVVDQIW